MLLPFALLIGLLPMLPALLWLRRRQLSPQTLTQRMTLATGGLHLFIALLLVGVGTVWLFAPPTAQAAGLTQALDGDASRAFAAALAVGMGSLGAAYAVSTTGSAAVGAIAEKPEIFGRALIFVGLAEGVAIYGLIIAFIILGG